MPDPTRHRPIGVFDSGIGGLSVANAVCGLLPREDLLYVADNKRAPYGPRPATDITAYSREITRFLLGRGAKLIVVACNTATSLAIDALRAEFPGLPFVGLEPAVKPAGRGKRVGVLATAATLHSERYRVLKARYLGGRDVYEDACRGLVPVIEAEQPGSAVLRDRLSAILEPMLAGGIDTLVLGCTHYPMVKADIEAVCGPRVNVIDPSAAAARQAVRMLKQHDPGLAGDDARPSPSPLSTSPPRTRGRAHLFYATGTSLPLQRALLRLPELNGRRKLVVPHANLR